MISNHKVLEIIKNHPLVESFLLKVTTIPLRSISSLYLCDIHPVVGLDVHGQSIVYSQNEEDKNRVMEVFPDATHLQTGPTHIGYRAAFPALEYGVHLGHAYNAVLLTTPRLTVSFSYWFRKSTGAGNKIIPLSSTLPTENKLVGAMDAWENLLAIQNRPQLSYDF